MPYCRSSLFVFALSALLTSPMVAQTAAPADTETPAATLKINVRTVLVDVVALDKKNQVVPNLHKEDFKVFEDGKEQKINNMQPRA